MKIADVFFVCAMANCEFRCELFLVLNNSQIFLPNIRISHRKQNTEKPISRKIEQSPSIASHRYERVLQKEMPKK